MKQIRFTKEGFEKLQKDYAALRASRPDAVEHLRKSREMGDLSENGYYKSSRAKLSFIDRQLREMGYSLKQAVVVPSTNTSSIDIGSVVMLKGNDTEVTYHIVGDLEADPKVGCISLLSPLGRSLIGKKAGDQIEVVTPRGKTAYKIISVSFNTKK